LSDSGEVSRLRRAVQYAGGVLAGWINNLDFDEPVSMDDPPAWEGEATWEDLPAVGEIPQEDLRALVVSVLAARIAEEVVFGHVGSETKREAQRALLALMPHLQRPPQPQGAEATLEYYEIVARSPS
jgi:hypothetical protein